MAISRREFMVLGSAVIGCFAIEACLGQKSQAKLSVPPTEAKPEPRIPLIEVDLNDIVKGKINVYEIPNLTNREKPYVGINTIKFYANLRNGLLFSIISLDSNYTPNEWGKEARAGFCPYDDSFDASKQTILGQVDPPKFDDPNDFELEAIAFLYKSMPDLKYDFLEYQKIPPTGVDMMYMIREGIAYDQNGNPNPRSLIELRARFKYSDPSLQS